jgi:asparagine synthase (glutamine-hydrolysing)
MESAVKSQMVADVPIGILLSGGVDSSLITSMAAKSSGKIKTFTVGFDQSKDYDERSQARMISKYFGTEHNELNAEDIKPDIMKKLAYFYDEPIADSSMVPTYFISNFVNKHCTVALGGDGGDELFGGYKHYDRLLWCKKYLGWLPKKFRKQIANLTSEFLPNGFKGKNWLQSLDCDFETDVPLIASLFDRKIRNELVNDSSSLINAESIWKDRAPKNLDFLERLTRMDFENYLTEDILVKVDRASMLNSLEIRAPFLDKNIIEFAFGRIPSSLKANTLERKIFLKKLTKKILPAEFDRQRKHGFSIPLKNWLKHGRWKIFFQEILFDEQCIFHKEIIKNLFNNQNKGFNNAERIFNLTLFELWRREYSMKL